jgi:hypothetical protein
MILKAILFSLVMTSGYAAAEAARQAGSYIVISLASAEADVAQATGWR